MQNSCTRCRPRIRRAYLIWRSRYVRTRNPRLDKKTVVVQHTGTTCWAILAIQALGSRGVQSVRHSERAQATPPKMRCEMNVAHTPIRCPSARRFLHFSQRYAVLSACMRAPNNMVLLEISSRARHRGGAPDYPLTKRELNLTQKDANSTAGSDVARQTHPDDPSILDVVF